jgi:hypothetical protein
MNGSVNIKRDPASSARSCPVSLGPAGAACILADTGGIACFPDRSHLASWTGSAQPDRVSAGLSAS